MRTKSRLRRAVAWLRGRGPAPSGGELTEDHVAWAYRLLLDREPESAAVVAEKLRSCRTTRELREAVLTSREFLARNRLGDLQAAEGRWRAEDDVVRLAGAGLPLPPEDLILLVAGTPDAHWFLEGGARAAESLVGLLARRGRAPRDWGHVLDFGCGCGRVLRHWRDAGIPRLSGSDLDAGAVAWCAGNLPFAEVSANALQPPLACADHTFDLVYALSVFTHLPEGLQSAWFRELRRVLKPGGLLAFSAHGAPYRTALSNAERARFDAGELVVHGAAVAGTNDCAAFHPSSYVTGRLAASAGYEVLECLPEGATGNPLQDLYLWATAPATQ